MKNYNQTEFVTAPTLRRIAAFVIDIFIINTVVAYPFRPIIRSFEIQSIDQAFRIASQLNDSTMSLTVVGIALGFLMLLYFAFLEWRTGQTLGKLLLKIRVAGISGRISFRQALLRNIWFVPFFPFTLLWIIEPVYMFTNPERQRLTERWSSTRVVYQNV